MAGNRVATDIGIIGRASIAHEIIALAATIVSVIHILGYHYYSGVEGTVSHTKRSSAHGIRRPFFALILTNCSLWAVCLRMIG